MEKTVLVLTNSEDGEHSDAVIEKLTKRGERVFRLDVDRIPKGELEIHLSVGERALNFRFQHNGAVLQPGDVKSAWYRRPQFFNFPIKDRVQKRYAEEELSNLLAGLWFNLEDVFWLNNPYAMERARKKMLQLRLAHEIGFLVPQTIVTNSPDEAKEFYEGCEGKMIFKAIYLETMDYENLHLNIPTTLVTKKHINRLSLVRGLPALFQELLPKAFELRVTIVGEHIFAVRSKPPNLNFAPIDWRPPDVILQLEHEIMTLDQVTVSRCRTLMKILGLSFAAIDFVGTPDGRLFFLEINPNAQWYWLKKLTGAKISDAIADVLSEASDSGNEKGGD